MQFEAQPQSMLWKIAILIIALVGDVSCIRNGDGYDEQKHISAKLKNFFPSEQLNEVSQQAEQIPRASARVINGGFRPSELLEFTPSDVMPSSGAQRYPPSYLEPNYRHEIPSSLTKLSSQTSAMDKQFSFPESARPQQSQQTIYHNFASTQVPTTPVVSYLDPYTQQNYRYTPTAKPTPPSFIQYQREQPDLQDDQTYTVQSSLIVGSNSPHAAHAATVDDVYLKRPGYVFDESPSTVYRRPATPSTTASSHKISYDSHDYPPPSYAAQQTSNFEPQHQQQRPQPTPATAPYRPSYNRQDVNDNRPLAGSSIHEAAYASQPQFSSSNYANNFGNYLQRPPGYPDHSQAQSQPNPAHYQYEPLVRPQRQQQPQQQQQQRPGHNYYEYQIGEVPPQQPQHQLNYRPGSVPAYRPPPYQQSIANEGASGGGGFGGSGLATLASLLTSTQQYAPQFTNLLLGGGGSGSPSTSSSPLGSLLGAFTGTQSAGQQQHARPPNLQLIRALENIARNDDLQCVPKVLCQMIAGQTLRGQLPDFITSPAITKFLAGFPVASPALIYGRAALLGISGGEQSCRKTYESCPKNEMEIIHYLNNHRGGFFKFFSEPEEQSPAGQQSVAGDGSGSLFSILSALTGGGQGQVTRTTPRPVPRPTQRPSTDIADGIGSFFTRVLGEYLSGVEYQRRRRRRSLFPTEIKRNFQTDDGHLMPVDFHDEEDDLDTRTLVKFQNDDEEEAAKAHTELIGVLQFPDDEGEGRILHFKNIASEEQEHHDDRAVRFPDATAEAQRENDRKVIYEFNRNAAQRKLRFPQEHDDESGREAKQAERPESWGDALPNGLGPQEYGVNKRRGKRIVFKDSNGAQDDFDERLREEQLKEDDEQFHREQQIRDTQLRETKLRETKLRETKLRETKLREIQLRDTELRETQLREEQLREEQKKEQHAPPNAVYEDSAPPQRGARVIFPDHYERFIRKGKVLNRPTYAPKYEYNYGAQDQDRLVVSDEHRPSNYYRLEMSGYQTTQNENNANSFMNYGEYMPGLKIRFVDSNDQPSYMPQYNYPNVNYISDNRYSNSYQKPITIPPKHEDNKNIYVNNALGITEYYISPDGRKVYLNSG